jgi:hypothetical protein
MNEPPESPEVLRSRLDEARALEDPIERAARLHALGHALARSERQDAVAQGRLVLLEAAALGNPYGAHDAAQLLLRGEGGEANPNKALVLLEEAAQAGLGNSALQLGWLLLGMQGRAEAGVRWLERAAQLGEAEANYLLGLAHFRGLGGLKVDAARARALHQLAAEKGVVEAGFELSLLLELGLGGPVDVERARQWEERAAQAGHPRACLNRAVRFVRATPPDMASAVLWYERAARAGNAEAAARLCKMYLTGQGVPLDKSIARQWFMEAAALGYDWDAVGSDTDG